MVNCQSLALCCVLMVAVFVLLAGRTFGFAPLQPTPARRVASLRSRMAASSSSVSKMLEVEQKFPFSDRSRLEEGLRQRGFEPVKELTMVDWYFDRFVENQDGDSKLNLEFPLVRKDHWLRYREDAKSGDGQWQLKRGNKSSGGGLTVYEEIEGIQAVEIARSVLRASGDNVIGLPIDATRTFDGHSVPEIPISDCEVLPFARIVTHRAKWKQQTSEDTAILSDLVVDLDTTPDGFAVGEVEVVVEGEECSSIENKDEAAQAQARNDQAIAVARESIQTFLASLLEEEGTSTRAPMGKLEQFLSQKRPRMYEACVEAGVIPKPRPASNE